MTFTGPYQSQTNAVASYNYTDISRGEGIEDYYCTITDIPTYKGYVLSPNPLLVSNATGYINSTFAYYFKSLPFKLQRTIKGTAYLSGWADYTAGAGIVGTAQVLVESGTRVFGGEGDIEWSSDAEVNESGPGTTLKKTIVINDYVNKVTLEIKEPGGNLGYVNLIWRYEGDNSLTTTEQDTNSVNYVTKTFTHANNDTMFVNAVEVWMQSPAGTAYVQNVKVYQELTSGITRTAISSELSTNAKAADQGFSLALPLTQTTLGEGELIICKFTKSGGTGNFIVDPTNEILTNQSLKLSLPFRVDVQ
jgi:hypothetical protein